MFFSHGPSLHFRITTWNRVNNVWSCGVIQVFKIALWMMVSCDATSVQKDRMAHASIKLVIAWQGFCCRKKKAGRRLNPGRYASSLRTMWSSSIQSHAEHKMTSHFLGTITFFLMSLNYSLWLLGKFLMHFVSLVNYLLIFCARSLSGSVATSPDGQEIGH